MTTLITPTARTVALPAESSHLSRGGWCGHEATLLTATVVMAEQRGCGGACGGIISIVMCSFGIICIAMHYLTS